MGASGERVIFYFSAWEVVPLGRSLSSVYFSNYILNLTTLFKVSKITVDGDCSHEIKRHSLFERKVMTNLGSILKSKDITLLTKVPSSQSYRFFQESCVDVRVRL